MDLIKLLAEPAVALMEGIGIGVIVIGALFGGLAGGMHLIRGGSRSESFYLARHRIGSAMLLGLEFLVAADIIQTVAIELTLETTISLAAVVLIRTLLSFTLEVEMNGRWPWQAKPGA